MELPARLDPWIAWLTDAGMRLVAFDLPVPDAALIAAAVLVVLATALSQRGRVQDAHAQMESLYQAELLTANRRAQQARGELRRAKLEIEKERQKRRRESRGAAHRRAARAADGPAAPVPMIEPAVLHG